MADIIQADPAPLSKAELDEQIHTAFQLEQAVKAGLRAGREALWDTAEALYRFNELRGWQVLGGYDTLGDWLADPDIGITRSTFFRMVETWREVVVMREIDPAEIREVELTKLTLALPAVKKGKETIEDAIDAARTNGWRDMRDHYKQLTDLSEPDAPVVDEADVIQPDPDDVAPADDPEYTEDELYGPAQVPRWIANQLAVVLARCLAELGDPKRKAMSADLRNLVIDTLESAYAEGLADV